MKSTSIICIYIILSLFDNYESFIVISPQNQTAEYYSPSLFINREIPQNLTGFLILADPLTDCKEIKNAKELRGNIGFVVSSSGCSLRNQFLRIQEAGAIGIVMAKPNSIASSGKGTLAFLLQSEKILDLIIPGVEIAFNESLFQQLSNQNNKFPNILIEWKEDKNYYYQIVTLSIYTALSVLFGIIIFVLSFYKLFYFVKIQKPQVNPVQLCLFLFSTLGIELIIFGIDPFYAWGIYPFEISNMLVTGAQRLILMIIIIIIFYWESAMRLTSAEGIISLKKFKIPAIIIASFIFFLDLIISYLRAFRLLPDALNIFYIFLSSIVCLVTAIFYFIVAIRVLLRIGKSIKMKRNENQRKKLEKRLQKMSILMILTGFGLLVWLFGILLYTLVSLPNYLFATLFLSHIGMFIISISGILVFKIPKRKEKIKKNRNNEEIGNNNEIEMKNVEENLSEEFYTHTLKSSEIMTNNQNKIESGDKTASFTLSDRI